MTDSRFRIAPSGDLDIVIERPFDAPRERVFDAWTNPEKLRQWLGMGEGWTMPVCEFDRRVGGRYRYVWRGPDGFEMGVGGEVRELDAPARISVTETFDVPWYPGSAEITHELEETDGVTTSKITLRYESSDARDTVFASPMREGLAAGCVRLDALLASESA